METNDFKASSTRRKLRLVLMKPCELPSHPLLPTSTTPVNLCAFVCEVLNEALAFSDSVIPSTFAVKGSPKSSAPSTAKVQLLSSDVLKGEAWFARRSEHKNSAIEGSASYQEFEDGIYYNHSIHEMDYTPDVFDAYKVLDYKNQIFQVGSFQQWSDVEMERELFHAGGFDQRPHFVANAGLLVFEMCHSIPSPLENRVFSTLVVRGKDSSSSFVVAQIPVDLSGVTAAMYSTGRNRSEGGNAQKREKVTIGQYVSVERVKVRENNDIVWEMATASDAKGNLPIILQKMGVPGAVVKDVGFFMKWTSQGRK